MIFLNCYKFCYSIIPGFDEDNGAVLRRNWQTDHHYVEKNITRKCTITFSVPSKESCDLCVFHSETYSFFLLLCRPCTVPALETSTDRYGRSIDRCLRCWMVRSRSQWAVPYGTFRGAGAGGRGGIPASAATTTTATGTGGSSIRRTEQLSDSFLSPFLGLFLHLCLLLLKGLET